MAAQVDKFVTEQRPETRRGDAEGMGPRQAVEAVEAAMASDQADRLGPEESARHHDIAELARFIQSVRTEIAELRPQEINEEHLPTATDELDAIVHSTESATNSIFEAVEAIESLTAEMDPQTADAVTNHVTAVYEACSFQDITGQRITKVVFALKQIEEKIDQLLSAFGGNQDGDAATKAATLPKKTGTTTGTPARTEEDLLNGPQLEGDAISQDDIDALLGSD